MTANEALELLLRELESDIQLATTRDQHIRCLQRLQLAQYVLDHAVPPVVGSSA